MPVDLTTYARNRAMTQRSYQAWAPPLIFGPYIRIDGLGGGPFEVTVDADNDSSQAPSSFTGEIEYFAEGGSLTWKTWLCPGSITVTTEANSWQQPKFRFKSHSTGQNVSGTWSTRALPGKDATRQRGQDSLRDVLGRNVRDWSESDVRSVMASNDYWNNSSPNHEHIVHTVRNWFDLFHG